MTLAPTENLLLNYAENFAGYGNLRAPVWFVGIEESGGRSFEEIKTRLNLWDSHGKPSCDDLLNVYRRLGNQTSSRVLQPTWRQLIRLHLHFASGRRALSEEDILKCQQKALGTRSGQTCLLELFPLPCPNHGVWNYGNWFKADWLQSRAAYKSRIEILRSSLLRRLISEHRPRVVLFYFSSYRQTRERIGSAPSFGFTDLLGGQLTTWHDPETGTTFYSSWHPAYCRDGHRWSQGNIDDYFARIANQVLRDHPDLRTDGAASV